MTWESRLVPGPADLIRDEPEWGRAPGDREWRCAELVQGPPVDREGADGDGTGVDDVQVVARRVDLGIERTQPGWIVERRAAEQGQGPVAGNPVARDRRARGVDREEVLAIRRDGHPAGCGLVVSEG